MASIIGKNFAILDWNDFPATVLYKDGKPLRNRKLLISPFTTGEPIMILKTTIFPTEEKRPRPSKQYLHDVGHKHEWAEEVMIYDEPAVACADDIVFDIPRGGAYAAKPGCWHGSAPADSTVGMTITCIFTPSIPEDQDPDYPELIRKTREYLKGVERL